VEVPITINVARSGDEAERQARGEDLTRPEALIEAEAAAERAEPVAEGGETAGEAAAESAAAEEESGSIG
jgi:large subunit ribosomal protein L9